MMDIHHSPLHQIVTKSILRLLRNFDQVLNYRKSVPSEAMEVGASLLLAPQHAKIQHHRSNGQATKGGLYICRLQINTMYHDISQSLPFQLYAVEDSILDLSIWNSRNLEKIINFVRKSRNPHFPNFTRVPLVPLKSLRSSISVDPFYLASERIS